MSWFKNLFKTKHQVNSEMLMEYQRRENQFEEFFCELRALNTSDEIKRGQIHFPISIYSFEGGWLTDSYYFDIYIKIRYEYDRIRVGRLYVGRTKPIFDEPGVRIQSCVSLDKSHVQYVDELTRTNLKEAINFIIPGFLP